MAKNGPVKKGKKKTHVVKGKKNTTLVTSKSVADAKSKSGVFKSRPAYKGKESKSGVTTHDGTFHKVTGPVSRRAARKVLAKDKALYGASSAAHSARTNRFATAKRRKSK